MKFPYILVLYFFVSYPQSYQTSLEMFTLTLSTKILVGYVGVLAIANLIGGLTTIFIEQGHVNETTDTVSDILTVNELAALQERSATLLETSRTLFDQLVGDVNYQHKYALEVFSDTLPIVSNYTNFDVETFPSPAPPDVNAAGKSNNFSFYYHPGTPTTSTLDSSAQLDNSHGPIVRSNVAYAGLYMGFEDGLWRHVPYLNVGTSLRGLVYTCFGTTTVVTGYDPRCRDWYVPAKEDQVNVQFSAPYEDASTGLIMITLSRAVVVSSSLVGVVGADVTLDALAKVVLSATVLKNGYTYLCDGLKNLIVHPELNSPASVFKVSDLEFSITAEKEIIDFDALLDDHVLQGQVGQTPFVKDGDRWFVTYGPVEGTGYFLLMVVPESDVVAPAVSVETYADQSIAGLITVVSIVLVAVVAGGFMMTTFLSAKVTAPVNVMTKILTDIAANKMEGDDLEGGAYASDTAEVDGLRVKINNLFLAIKFSTDAYYSNDYAAALIFLQRVEDMFQQIEQRRALGVVHNNRGNILRRHTGPKDEYRESLSCLEQAISNIRLYCQQAATDLAVATQANDADAVEALTESLQFFEKILASRLSNCGDCMREAGRLAEAEAALSESIGIYTRCLHLQGMLQARGNYGLLKLAQGQLEEADKEFRGALDFAELQFKNAQTDENMAAMQFASMNLGTYHKKRAEMLPPGPQRVLLIETALSHFYYALSVSDRIHKTVQTQCLVTLALIFKAEYGVVGEVAVERLTEMFPDAASSFGMGPSTVNFLIDVSISMRGRRIASCEDTMVDIVRNKMHRGDVVGVHTFAADLNTLVPPTAIMPAVRDSIVANCERLKHTCTVGRTHFFKCLIEMGQMLLSLKPGKGPIWLVALTDGEDNERKTSYETTKKFFVDNNISLIVVSVGIDDPKVVSILQYLATEEKYYIRAGDDPTSITNALQQGFSMAASGGNVVMEAL